MAPKKIIQEKNENSNEITEPTEVVIEPKPKRKPRAPKEDKEDKPLPKPKAKSRAKKVKESTESNNSNDEESDKETVEKQVKKQTRKPKEVKETVDKPKVTRGKKKNDSSILSDINNLQELNQELNQDNLDKMYSEIQQKLLNIKKEQDDYLQKANECGKKYENVATDFLAMLDMISSKIKDSKDSKDVSSSSSANLSALISTAITTPIIKSVPKATLVTIDENQLRTVNIDDNSENITIESNTDTSDTESLMSN